MIRLTLVRLESGDQGTFGVLDAFGLRFFTGELPWRENAQNVSCIPPGLYSCFWTYSPAFRRMLYEVRGVDRRSGVRIHSANLMGDRSLGFRSQLQGCIALGEKLGELDGQRAILLSAPAVRRFSEKLRKNKFELEIVNGISLPRPD